MADIVYFDGRTITWMGLVWSLGTVAFSGSHSSLVLVNSSEIQFCPSAFHNPQIINLLETGTFFQTLFLTSKDEHRQVIIEHQLLMSFVHERLCRFKC